MAFYALKRLLGLIPVVFGVSLLLFIIFNVAGGDPSYNFVGKSTTAAELEALREELGLNKSLAAQYFDYVKQIVTFDYGRSLSTRQKIGQMFLDGIGPSFSFASIAFVGSFVLAIVIAMFSAFYHNTWIDKTLVVLSVTGMSISMLALIIFGQYFLAFQMGWFPINGYDTFPYNFSYIMLPAIILILIMLGYDLRFFRTVFLEEINKDFIRTARAKGLSEPRILFTHVLKNSLIPILTRVVMQLPGLVTGSLVLENFFSIPGLGSMIMDAINSSDFPVLKSAAVFLSILYMILVLAGDLLIKVADPRVELK